MPQVFQVLRCYKCLIFQVHQTKKDKKWICKVCDEKQSHKRHYGIGTAKDCRTHVQKLNNMQADKELTQKYVDSEDSDYEDTVNYIKIKHETQAVVDTNVKKESKWLAYVEKEEICEVSGPEHIDDTDMHLKLCQKRKFSKKSQPFEVPKVCYESTKIDDSDKKISNNIKNQQVTNKRPKFQTINHSKWAQFIEADENLENDHEKVLLANDHLNIENIDNNKDNQTGVEYDYNHKVQDQIKINDHQKVDTKNYCTYTKNDIHQRQTNNKAFYALCDDSDLDNILEF